MTSKRLVLILVNLLDELEQIMGRYDFLEAIRVIFSKSEKGPNLTFSTMKNDL